MDGMDGNGREWTFELVLARSMSHYVTQCHTQEGTIRVSTAKKLSHSRALICKRKREEWTECKKASNCVGTHTC